MVIPVIMIRYHAPQQGEGDVLPQRMGWFKTSLQQSSFKFSLKHIPLQRANSGDKSAASPQSSTSRLSSNVLPVAGGVLSKTNSASALSALSHGSKGESASKATSGSRHNNNNNNRQKLRARRARTRQSKAPPVDLVEWQTQVHQPQDLM
jgi:hypothetical protein